MHFTAVVDTGRAASHRDPRAAPGSALLRPSKRMISLPPERHTSSAGMALPERRIDVTDGEAYTKEEFVEFYGGLVEWGMAQVALSAEEELSAGLQMAVSIADESDDDEAAAELEAERIRQLAAQEERRADEQWRQLMEGQRRRSEAAEEEAWKRAQEEREERRRQQRQPKASLIASGAQADGGGTSSSHASAAPARDDDEPDAMGWTPREQRLLEAAMRANPPTSAGQSGDSSIEERKRRRWEAIAAAVPGRSVKEVVVRCRSLRQAVRAALPPPLLRLDADLLLLILEHVGGRALCNMACVNKELTSLAHDESLWMPMADALPSKWAYSKRDRGGEEPWAFTLRVREGLYGAWKKLNDHKAGCAAWDTPGHAPQEGCQQSRAYGLLPTAQVPFSLPAHMRVAALPPPACRVCPYLNEIGTIERGTFKPSDGPLDYRVTYGAICELVQMQTKLDGGLSHRTYKAVAEQLVSLSANPRSAVPPELHMTVREIYKTCYPSGGFGAGIGSGAFAPGLQAGGSSTNSSTSGTMVGKGLTTSKKKVQDEEFRKRLDTKHTFLNLVPH